jgi:hypothetical protein
MALKKRNPKKKIVKTRKSDKKNQMIAFWMTFCIMLTMAFGLLFLPIFQVTHPTVNELDLNFVSVAYGTTKVSAKEQAENPEAPSAKTQTDKQETSKNIPLETPNKVKSQVATQESPSAVATSKTSSKPTEEAAPAAPKAKYAFDDSENFDSDSEKTMDSKQNGAGNSKNGGSKGSGNYGFGLEGDLNGRGSISAPSLKSPCTAKGVLVIDAVVNDAGKTLSATPNYKHKNTNTSDPCLVDEALRIVKALQWDKSSESITSGSVILNFR